MVAAAPEELRDKGIIVETLYDVAQAARNKRNIGAHPGRDPEASEQVSEAGARAVYNLVRQVFLYVCEMPAEAQALMA